MIQYLYAAYSLPKTFPQITWRLTLLGIAREEMGHLMSAQNLLLALGAPLNFDREDYPFNKLYPFPLELRPISVQSLARYVLAEMPDLAAVPPGLGFDLAEVRQDAGAASGINRVGALFELMIELTAELGEPDIVAISPGYQAEPSEWRAAINNLVLAKVGSVPDMASLLDQIGEQGEGPGLPAVPANSHFVRLFKIYKAAKTSCRCWRHAGARRAAQSECPRFGRARLHRPSRGWCLGRRLQPSLSLVVGHHRALSAVRRDRSSSAAGALGV